MASVGIWQVSGDGEMGRWGVGRWGNGEMGRWERFLLRVIILT
ncbi:hypothetical protein [Moorena sp. SIOASIH]|nr:hypothetical protein [Moorena sp. SIOASIH]